MAPTNALTLTLTLTPTRPASRGPTASAATTSCGYSGTMPPA
jgi:hypothetical protein